MTTEILEPFDSIAHIRKNFRERYPASDSVRQERRPVQLHPKQHQELHDMARKHKVTLHEMFAAILDFWEQYEAENKKELNALRKRKR